MHDEQQYFAGSSYRLAWRGRVLKFGPISQRVKAICVSECKKTALAEHRELVDIEFPDQKDPASAASRRARDEQFYDLVRSGAYAWGGVRFIAWRQNNRDNERVFLSALLEQGGTALSDADLRLLRQENRGELLLLGNLCLLDDESPNSERPAGTMELLAEMERPIENPTIPNQPGGNGSPKSSAISESATANSST